MTDAEKIAYAAGLFDGEGYVGIELSPRARATVVMLNMAVAMRTPHGPRFLHELFGGWLDLNGGRRNYPMWRWRAMGGKAAEVLRAMRPYLREKAGQADLCLEARSIQERRPKGQGAAYRPEDRARVTEIHSQVRALKRA